MSDRPFAYVCSPLRGDVEANIARAREYCRQVFEAGYNPVCGQIFYTQFLRDDIPEEREAGMAMGVAMLPQCRVLVICGDEITAGMSQEIRAAEQLKIPVLMLDTFLSERVNRKPEIGMPRDTGNSEHEKLGGLIRAYITNEDKYAEGELVGVWHSFPTTAEDVQASLKTIGLSGSECVGYYIDDYETGIPGLYDHLPLGADIDELNYLAVKLEGMSERERDVFEAVMLSGRYCGSVKDLINVAGNLNCFSLQPIFNKAQYGLFLSESYGGEAANLAVKLKSSSDPADRTAASLIGLLEWYLDAEGVGQKRITEERGSFTKKGYLTENGGFTELYTGPEDIPGRYSVSKTPDRDCPPTAKPSVLERIAAARAERDSVPRKPKPEKPKSHSEEL